MDFESWIDIGITKVYSTHPSYFGVFKQIRFIPVSNEKEAFSLALGYVQATQEKVGVVLESFPSICNPDIHIYVFPNKPNEQKNPKEDLENIRRMTEVALRPCVLVGECSQDLNDFLQTLKIPCLAIPESLDHFAGVPDSFFGRVGFYGDLVGNMILQNADLVFLLGKVNLDFVDKSWFVREGHVVHLGHFSPQLPCHGFYSNLHDYLGELKRKKWDRLWSLWMPKCRSWRDKWIHLFPTEDQYGILPGMDPYFLQATFHQCWDQKTILAKKDKWFSPVFQQGVLSFQNRFIAVPEHLDIFQIANSYFTENQDQPLFLFLDQSGFSIENIKDLERNPIPIGIFLFREPNEKSFLLKSASTTEIETLFLTENNFSNESLEFETLPILIDVEATPDFKPYPSGGLPFECMPPFQEEQKWEMIIPPFNSY